MNREIKFRAFSKKTKKMYKEVIHVNINSSEGIWTTVLRNDPFEAKTVHYSIQPEHCKIMQFTGLKDKNEKEIYEGDIVIYDRGVGNWTGQRMSTTHEIVFNDEVFAFVMKYGSSYIKLRKHWNYIYEVVGNIYENPELLSTPTAVL